MSRRFEPLVASLAVALLVAAAFGQSPPPATPAAGVVTIVGSVVDASLTPLAGVDVILERLTRVEARTKTDAAGTYRFTAVAPGAVRVRAELNGFPSLSRDVQVPAGATTIQLPLVMSRPQDEVAKAASEVQHAANASTIAGVPVPPSGQRPAAEPSRAVPRERDMAQASAPPPYAVPQMMPDTPRYGRPQPNREGYAHATGLRAGGVRTVAARRPLRGFALDSALAPSRRAVSVPVVVG